MTINGFFSYSRIDWEADHEALSDLVSRIENQSRAAHGSRDFSLWRDETGLRWGVDWRSRLHEQIGMTSLFFVLLSPSWIKSGICREELAAFLEREAEQSWTGRVFVIQIRDVPADDREINAEMRQIVTQLEKRQAKRWLSLLDADQATRETAFRQAGKEIAEVLRLVNAKHPTEEVPAHSPPSPPTQISPLPVSGQPLVSGDFYAPSQAKVDGHQSVMLNLVFAGQCKVTLPKKGRYVFGVQVARLHVRAEGGGHMLAHPDFDASRCMVSVECTGGGGRHRDYQIYAREEHLRGTVLAATSNGDHVPLVLIDQTDSMTVWAAAGLVKYGCPIAFREATDVLHRSWPSSSDYHPVGG